MDLPVVSICLPNLNTRPYLEERLATIFAQTLTHWELVVFDNFSEDGAWELLQASARTEPRMRTAQAPRAGLYANWNNCVRAARGKYVYIATSDDTMAPDCLEKMVDALEANADCDLAHCPLRMIDSEGNDRSEWWWKTGTFARSSGDLLRRPHIRRAPFDGLVHLLGKNVYVSITQLLIRRTLFDRVGFFPTQWGSVGDFNWEMKASLVANTVHVPDTWGGWRVHPAQATAAAALGSKAHGETTDKMIDDALQACSRELEPAVQDLLASRWTSWARDLRVFCRLLEQSRGMFRRRAVAAARLLIGCWAARQYFRARLSGRPSIPSAAPDLIRGWVEGVGIKPALMPVDNISGSYSARASVKALPLP